MKMGGLFLNNKSKILKLKKDKYFKMLLCLMLFISVVLYWNFIVYKNIYIFNDIGGDTHAIYWPVYKYIVTHIRQGNLSWWSFNFGIGTSILSYGELIFDPFNIILLLMPIRYLHYGILIVSILKIFCAGIIFYLYILKIGVKEYAALIVSLAWAFSGYIILWGQHYQFATMIVLFSFIMLAYEYWFQDNNKLLLVLSIGLLAMNSPYWMYMVSIYLFIYSIFRYLYTYEFKLNDYVKYMFNFFTEYILGLGVGCILFLPRCYLLLNSPRINNINFKIPLLWDRFSFFSALTRVFSNNLIGTYDYFGASDYYGILILSSTILSVLITPQIYLYLKNKNKKVFVANSLLFITLLIFPFASVAFNGFKTITTRWTFIMIFSLLIALGKALQNIFELKPINVKLLINTVIIDISVLSFSIFYVCLKTRIGIDKNLILYVIGQVLVIILFFIMYLQLFVYFSKNKEKKYIKYITILLVVELVIINYPTVNRRIEFTSNYITNKNGYLDSSNDSIKYINNTDKGFFRVDKDYMSVFLNDGIFQNYKGLKSYNSLNAPSYVQFVENVGGTFLGGYYNYILGFDDRLKVQTLLGVKYILSKNNIAPLGYEKVKSFNNINLYRNNYFLPLGVTYDSFIPLDEFNNLSKSEKDDALLNAFVIDYTKAYGLEKFDKSKLTSKNECNLNLGNKMDLVFNNTKVIENNFPQSIKYLPLNVDPMFIFKLEDNKGSLKLRLNIKTATNSVGQVFYRTNETSYYEEASVKFDINPNKLEYEINLNKSNISEIRVDVGESNNEVEITNLTVSSENIDNYKKAINKLKKNSLSIDEYSDSKIRGNLNVDKKKMLFLSIPYDKGWHLKVDGKRAEIQKINIGFIGTVIDKGNHTIELTYTPTWLRLGTIVTIISIGIVMVIHLIQKKRYL